MACMPMPFNFVIMVLNFTYQMPIPRKILECGSLVEVLNVFLGGLDIILF